MLRGEIRVVNLDPARGGEANKRRPAVVVSNDQANETTARLNRGVIAVAPLTSNVARVYPFQVLLPATASGLRVDSKVQAEQVRALSIDRVGPAIGHVPLHLMTQIDDALRLHLSL